MVQWFAANLSTIVIGLILLAIVVAIVVHLVRMKKKGKSTCGCGCSHCAMQGKCHSDHTRN